MSLVFGPKKYDVVPTTAQVKVYNLNTNTLATLSSPVSITNDGSVTFEVATSGNYTVEVVTPNLRITDKIYLTDVDEYDITDYRSYTNASRLDLESDVAVNKTTLDRYSDGLYSPEPTTSTTQIFQSTISNAILQSPSPSATSTLQGASLNVDTSGDEAFTFLGGGGMQLGSSWPNTQFLLPTSLYPNTYGIGVPTVWTTAFGYDGSIFEVRYKYAGAHARIRVWVDGLPVTERMVAIGGNQPGYEHVYTVDFGSRAVRTIQLDFGDVPFGGVWRQADANIWKLPNPKIRAILIGDSHAGGSNENTHGYTWPRLAMDDLRISDFWNNAIGGSGYTVNGQGTTYYNRVATDVTPWNPDIVLVQGGYNDGSQTLSTVFSAATTLYTKLLSDLPSAKIIVVGPFNPSATPDSVALNLDTGLRARALSAGLPYVSLISGDVIDGKGTVVLNAGPWITASNAAAYIGTDNVHPNDAGHDYLAKRFTQAYEALDISVDTGNTSSTQLLVLGASDDIPVGTPSNTLIVRTG